MKKLLLSLIALLPILAVAQTVATFSNRSAKRTDMKVRLITKDNKPCYVSFEAETKSGFAEVWVKYKDLPKFHAALIEARNKYVEWSEVADKNHVMSLRKEIPVKFPKVEYWWEYGKERFTDSNTGWKMIFSASDQFRFAFMLASVTHWNNRFIKEKYAVTFISVEDFDSLINALDPQKIKAAADAIGNPELFK